MLVSSAGSENEEKAVLVNTFFTAATTYGVFAIVTVLTAV
jgi:hypothetical protein